MIKQRQKKYFFYSSIILLVAITLFSVGALYKKGQQLAVEYISKKTQSEMANFGKGGQLQWETLSVSFIPLKVKIKKVKVNIPNSKLFPAPLIIDTLIVEPDYRTLLNRTLSAKITMINSNITIKAKNKTKKTISIKNYFSMDFLKKIPISNLILKETHLLFIKDTKTILVKKLNTNIRLSSSKITIRANTPFMEIGSQPVFSSSIYITIKPDMIDITHFKAKNKNSWMNISSHAKGKIESQEILSGRITVNGSFLSQDLTAIAQIINSSFNNPFKGKITLNSQLNYTKASQLKGYIILSAEQLSAWDIFLSKIQIKGTIQNQIISFEKFHIEHPNQWNIDLTKSTMHLKKPHHFQTEVLIKNSQLKALFNTFNLKKIPVASLINGKWKCNGKFLIKQNFKCEGVTHFDKFTVYGTKNWTALNIPKLKITSQLGFENKIFTAKTLAQPGSHSHININSTLNEKNHFSSQYTGVIHLSDIKDLVYLSPKGTVNILDGTITASNNKLNIQSQLKIDQLVLSQFRIGNVETQLSYTEKGFLRFRKIKGHIKHSQYTGKLNINIFKNTIQVFTNFPYITLEDLKYALEDRMYFPFELQGTGTLSAYLTGPLKINAMNYSLHAQFFNIKWEQESFNEAVIQLNSKHGYVKTNKVELLKNKGKIVFQGQVDPKGNMIAKMTGLDLQLQESENISKITGLETSGIMNFNMGLEGYFLNPLSKATVSIKNSFYKGYPIGNSKINLNLRKNQIEANGSIAADKITIQKFIFPYKKSGRVKIQATTNNLNLKEMFLSKGDSTQLYNQFQSNINSTVNLTYRKNQFFHSATGDIKVDKLTVHANSYKLINKLPFVVKLKQGNIHTDPIFLQSGVDSLNIIQNEPNRIHLNGNIKLDFFIFIFPFIRIWEGNLTVNLSLNSQLSNLSPSGTIQLNDGFIQLNPHIDPFEEIYSDIKIENNKCIFQSLYTKLGGGTLQGKGDLHFPGKGNEQISTDIRGSFTQVQFSSLPGIYTKGSGQIFLTGKQIPYTLGITADIENSRIEKELASDQSDQVRVNPRLFLLEEHKENYGPIQMRFNLYLKDPIQIENSTIKSSFTGKIKITGYPINPLLSGTLKALPGGTIIFRDHEFEILSSKIVYFNNKPSDPLIDLIAKTFVQEESDTNEFSNEYNILLRAKGRGNAPVFTLTSTPTMTENDIISLLAFGARSVNFEKGNTINNIAKYSYYHLGPVLFQKAIGRELKDTLGVDQFLIVPHISSKNSSTATKLIVRKKIFNRLNLSASQTILDNHPERNIKAEYKINKNISVIGLWQNEDSIESRDKDTNPVGFIGLDWEYQVDF